MSDKAAYKYVKVASPATLEGGYKFEATVDGKTFMVTVPEGGVKEGDEFMVPYPKDSRKGSGNTYTAPMGAFKTSLFSCCEVVSQGLFWMGFCCLPLLEAQIMTRMSLDWCGRPTVDSSSTFGVLAFIFILFLVFNFWIPFLGIAYIVFMLVYGTRIRGFFRKKYEISVSGSCGSGDCLEDCCCMFWCRCCTGIQIERHLRDEVEYPYSCCAENGLPFGAPTII